MWTKTEVLRDYRNDLKEVEFIDESCEGGVKGREEVSLSRNVVPKRSEESEEEVKESVHKGIILRTCNLV